MPPTLPTGELFNPGCSSCRDGAPGCQGSSCDLNDKKSRGPKHPVWLSYTQLLMFYQPTRAQFPLTSRVGELKPCAPGFTESTGS